MHSSPFQKGPGSEPCVQKALRSELVTITFFLALSLCSLNANLLVVLLQSSKIFTRLGKFPFLHSFANIPVDERTLGVHEIELVVDAREHLSNSCCVANHAHGTPC